MHRNSPQIHHPVPQRPVQVPLMQSPPPPSQSSDPYDNPYGAPSYANMGHQSVHPAGAAAGVGVGGVGGAGGVGVGGGYPAQFAAFGQGANFFSDPMAAQMGFNVARAAMSGGTDFAEKNMNRYLSSLKPFFAVTNTYVLRKLSLLLNPWRHSPWSRQSSSRSSRQGETETIYLPPREDLNAPDMYIPLMSFVTYILLSSLLYGLSGSFHPELLGYTASSAMGSVVFELIVLKLGCYLLSIGNSQLLDCVAYSGYKFVGVIVIIFAKAMLGGWLSRLVFVYAYAANAFFLLRSLKYVLLPEENDAGYAGQRQMRKRRTWFLFGYAYVVQLVFMITLTSGVGKKA
ncbi:YIF1-domain-containing protein [Pyronema omphalodes]|nr:YIF1-domain-containing protein [Pyronema omphalodes]